MKKVFDKWFWAWLGGAIILSIAMIIVGQPYANTMAATIMATFFVVPVRRWLYRLTIWAIDYGTSINTSLKDKLNPIATYNKLIDPSKREENMGFYRSLRVAIFIVTLVLSLLCMIFPKASFNIVYAWLHTIEYVITREISWLRLLLYVINLLTFCWVVYWSIGQVLNATMIDPSTGKIDPKRAWWRILIMVVGFYGKIILTGILLKFTSSMILYQLGFWSALALIGILSVLLIKLIRFIKGQTNTP